METIQKYKKEKTIKISHDQSQSFFLQYKSGFWLYSPVVHSQKDGKQEVEKAFLAQCRNSSADFSL